MKRSLMAGLAGLLMSVALTAFALPSVDDVQAEVGKGNYATAEEMMREVVAAKSGSAKAHYIYAEILAHNRRFGQAAEQAALAKQLDPAVKFTDPAKFAAFTQLLDQEQAAARKSPGVDRALAPAAGGTSNSASTSRVAPAAPAPAATSSGLPSWVWMIGIALIAMFAWRTLGARRQAAAGGGMAAGGMNGGAATAGYPPNGPMGANNPNGPYGPNYGPNNGPNYGPGAQVPGRGGGMLGTGLAVAGGVAAGMLAEKMLGGHHDQSSNADNLSQTGFPGQTPGLFDRSDDPAARELEQRQVDFGNDDSWGSDSGGGGDDDSQGGW